jgi:hypothetical protein
MTQLTPIASDDLDALELEDALTAHDRCDSCGAQAYIRVTLEHGELLFCAHHGAKYKVKLAATAVRWHDESSRLLDVAAE